MKVVMMLFLFHWILVCVCIVLVFLLIRSNFINRENRYWRSLGRRDSSYSAKNFGYIDVKFVRELPEDYFENDKLYLVLDDEEFEGISVKEYVFVDGEWVLIDEEELIDWLYGNELKVSIIPKNCEEE